MRLEFADGRVLDISSEDELLKLLDSLGSENNHAILGDDDYIQTAGNNGRYFFEYRDSSGMYESKTSDADLTKVKNIFSSYLTGTDKWKNFVEWNRTGDSESSVKTEYSAASPTGSSAASFNLKDEFINTAKRSVINWIKRKIK